MQNLLPSAQRLGAFLWSVSKPYARPLARTLRERCGTAWSIAETGDAGPAGKRWGDAPGHTCLAVGGPTDRILTAETGSGDRVANMRVFALALLELVTEAVQVTGET